VNDHADAIDWVRRAAQLAQDAGQDRRALQLALAATELAEDSGIISVAELADEVTIEQDVSNIGAKRSER
jgi:hypothetical protein